MCDAPSSRHRRARVSGAGSDADQRRHLPGERPGGRVREGVPSEGDRPASGPQIPGPAERGSSVQPGRADPGQQDAAARRHRHLEEHREAERCVCVWGRFNHTVE